jgi:hypothetical protein
LTQSDGPDTLWREDGTSNQRMLYDIRYFVSLGLSDEDVIRRLHERQAHRISKKQRSTKDFIKCIASVRHWNIEKAARCGRETQILLEGSQFI